MTTVLYLVVMCVIMIKALLVYLITQSVYMKI